MVQRVMQQEREQIDVNRTFGNFQDIDKNHISMQYDCKAEFHITLNIDIINHGSYEFLSGEYMNHLNTNQISSPILRLK